MVCVFLLSLYSSLALLCGMCVRVNVVVGCVVISVMFCREGDDECCVFLLYVCV